MTRSLFLMVFLSALGAAACGRNGSPAPPASQVTVATPTERVVAMAFPETFEAGGVIRARATATLASRVTAPIDAVYVSAGSPVRRGATLVVLEAKELQANAARARATLAAAAEAARAAESEITAAEASQVLTRLTNDRMRTLFEKRSATAQESDQAAAAFQEAEARLAAVRAHAAAARSARDAADATLRAAEATLSYATIAAPFDGIVADRLVDPGTMATAGTPLLVVEEPSDLRLHVLVDEFRARALVVGAAAAVKLDRDEAWVPAQVAEIGRVDPASHNFLVKLDVTEGAGARSGLFGRARFTSGERRAVSVPASSVVRRGQLAFVYAVTVEQVARLRPVVTGESAGDRIEILAGLADGDVVVVRPPPMLADGARVARQP